MKCLLFPATRIALCAALLFTPLVSLQSALLPTSTEELASLRDKAEKGNSVAEYNLGLVYADQTEPAYNPIEAYVWLSLAGAHGATGHELSLVTASLTPAQLVEAQKSLARRTEVATKSNAPAAHPSPELVAAEHEAEQYKLSAAEQQVRLTLREANVKELNLQLADTTKRIATLEAALVDKDRELASVKAASASPSPSVNDTARTEALAAAKVSIEQLREERDHATQTANNLADANSALQRQIDQTSEKLAASEASRADLSTKVAASANVATLTAERDALKEKLVAQQARIDQLNGQLASAQPSGAPNSKTTPSPAISDTASDTLKKQLADATDKLDASLRAYSLLQGEIDRLQKSLASLTDERVAIAAKLESAQAAAATVRTQLATSESDRAAAIAKVDAATRTSADFAALREQLRQTQDAAAAAASETQLLKARLALNNSPVVSAPTVNFVAPAIPAATAVVEMAPPAPATSEPAPSATASSEPRTHVVASGDSLTKLARQFYGSASRWIEIYDANRTLIKNPNMLPAGARLQIP